MFVVPASAGERRVRSTRSDPPEGGTTNEGWPGLERSEAPDGEKTRAARARLDQQAAFPRRSPGLPVGPAPATRPDGWTEVHPTPGPRQPALFGLARTRCRATHRRQLSS